MVILLFVIRIYYTFALYDNMIMKQKTWLYGMTPSELEDVVKKYDAPKFRAKQIAEWLYSKNALDFDSMTSLPKDFRARISEDYEVGTISPSDSVHSIDGTIKYIFPTLCGGQIESVYIPDRERATLCVSSQAGCKMNCEFCMTGRGGFKHQLSTGEILNQIRAVNIISPLTNIVYMGMGEPLDNFNAVMNSFNVLCSPWGYAMSPMRITLSTIGVIPSLKKFIEGCNVHLAVSLHNPFSDEREKIMPIEKAYKIERVVDLIRQYDFSHQRRVSFEYIMFDGINDTQRHISGLIDLLRGLKCRMNLIRFHKIPGSDLAPSPDGRIVKFRDILTDHGIITTIRASRGEDIYAACGMLKGKQ